MTSADYPTRDPLYLAIYWGTVVVGGAIITGIHAARWARSAGIQVAAAAGDEWARWQADRAAMRERRREERAEAWDSFGCDLS